MIKPLLQSQELIEAINGSDLIKSYCSVPKDWKNISKITKNSIHSHLGNGEFIAVFRSTPKYTDRIYSNMLIALQKEGVFKHLGKKYGDVVMEKFYLHDNPLLTNKLNFATTTFHSDQNPETTSVDGYAERSVTSETWSTIRSGAGTLSDDSDVYLQVRITAHASTSNRFILIDRSKLLFDTSSIGSSKLITDASLDLTAIVGADDFGLYLSIVSCTTASNTSLATSDYNVSTFGSTKFATDYLISSITDGVQFSMSLNSSGKSNINQTGISKFGLMLNKDAENSAPTWAASYDTRLLIYSAEQADPDYPGLTVTYIDPNYKNLTLMGVG